MRLRQIALVARDLRAAETDVCRALGLEVCYRDPGLATFGLRHGLYPIGDHLLEIVAPREPGTTAERFLDRRGDGGYMVLVQCDDVDRERSRVNEAGIRIVFEAEESGDHSIHGLHLHPKDVGGAILSIDQADPPESWAWAGRDWQYHRREDIVNDLVGVEMQSSDPVQLAEQWASALGRPVSASGTEPVIELDDAVVRFVPDTDGRGDGMRSADVVATDRSRVGETMQLAGFEFRLV